MEALFVIGRVVAGLYFLFNALNHLVMGRGMLTGYAGSKGVPAPALAVVGTGVLLLLGGLSLLLGVYIWLGALLLIVFLVPVAFIMHNFWAVQDQQARMVEFVNFTKNLALAGLLLMVMAYDLGVARDALSLLPTP